MATGGLMTREQWIAAQRAAEAAATTTSTSTSTTTKNSEVTRKVQPPSKKRPAAAPLSFQEDEEDDDNVGMAADPNTQRATRDRTTRRQELEEEWRKLQEAERREEAIVKYEYWNGRATRKSARVTRGTTIDEFLNLAKTDLNLPASATLMFVKGEEIIPGCFTFQDLTLTVPPLMVFEKEQREDSKYTDALYGSVETSSPTLVVDYVWYDANIKTSRASKWRHFALR